MNQPLPMLNLWFCNNPVKGRFGMDIILKKNEAEINEAVAKGLLFVFGGVLLILLLCWCGVFDVFWDMLIVLLVTSFITLFLPAIMILKLHLYNNSMKYIVIIATAIMAGTAYVLFTFQAVIIFVIPTIIAGFYMNKRLLYCSGIFTTIAIVLSHVITGFYLRQPWIEPFSGMSAILRYGAFPRILQYGGCFLLIWFLMDRFMRLPLYGLSEKEEGLLVAQATSEKQEKEKAEFEALLQGLTEREKSVFLLMIGGYTNMQIAEKLCLSNGTVKNYISVIYEKLGTRERNALIIKYSGFYKEEDAS